MNSTWTSSFTKIHPSNEKHDETMKSNVLQELLRINGFHLDTHHFSTKEKAQDISKNSPVDSTDKSLSENKLDNEVQEIRLQMTSKSVTRLQGQNFSENTTVLKVYSTSTLKDDKLINDKVSKIQTDSQKEVTPSRSSVDRRNRIHEENDKIESKLKSLYSQVEDLRVSCASKKEKDQTPVKETRSTEDRPVGDPFFSCPLELIEIYFSKNNTDSDKGSTALSQELSSMRTFPKEECCGSNSVESVFSLNSKDVDEEVWAVQTGNNVKHAGQQMVDESCLLNGDKFVEPTRDRQSTFSTDVDYKFDEKNQSNSREERLNCEKKINSIAISGTSEKEISKNEMGEVSLEDNKTNLPVKDEKGHEDMHQSVRLNSKKEKSNTKNTNFDLANNLHSLEDEKVVNIISLDMEDDLPTVDKVISSFSKFNDHEKKLRSKGDNCDKTIDVNLSTFEDDILTRSEENDETQNLNIYLNTAFVRTDESECNQISVKSNGSEISKSTLNSEESSDSKYSKTDLESMKIISNEEKNSLNENKIQIMIEKRENRQKDLIDDVRINVLNENVQSSEINDDKEKKQHEMTTYEIQGAKAGITTQKMTPINDDCKDINICKMLTSVHEQLTYDLQRMKSMEAKLQNKVSADSVNLTMALQLLDRTVARCKSYIHASSDSQEAELKIIQVLSVYGGHLITAVNKNTAILDEHAQHIDQMQFERYCGRNVNNKWSILKEISSSWRYWKNEIVSSIEIIYNLVKYVMINNEEKENVKDLRKYKSVHRRATNNLLAHDFKSKLADGRPKSAKISVVKKESVVETQMSIASNPINFLKQSKSKSSMKPLTNVVNREKGKILYDAQIIEKKTIDRGRIAKEPIRNKYRVFGNQQPAWKPGGIVKIPSSNSATTLQKVRPSGNVKEKINLLTEHARAEKPGKATSSCKRKVFNEALSMRDVTLYPRNPKIISKRSNTSLKISPRMKSRPGTLKVTPRNYSEAIRPISGYSASKYYKNKPSHDNSHQKDLKNSKAQRTSKEKSFTNDKREPDVRSMIHHYQFYDETDPVTFQPPSEPILTKKTKEETHNNKEEPTRDMDSSRFVETQLKFNDEFHENHQITEKSPDTLLIHRKAPDLRKNLECDQLYSPKKFESFIDVGINTNLDQFQSNRYPNFISIDNRSSMTNFSSNSDCTTKFEVSSRCQTSFNTISSSSTSNEEQKNEKKDLLPVSNEEKRRNTLMGRKEKIGTNTHAALLNMLKEFLSEQGVDTELVNRAEREMKDKQKNRRYSKKKSITFADEFFKTEDDQILQETKDEENMNREKNLKDIEAREENVIDCENPKGNIINWEKGSKRIENVIKNTIYYETNPRPIEIYDDNVINWEKSLKHTEAHREDAINCEETLIYTENIINCKKNIKDVESCKENDINPEKNSESAEIFKENCLNNCEKGLHKKEEYEKSGVNCGNSLQNTGNVIGHEKKIMYVQSCERNDTKSLKLSENHEENIINCEGNLRNIENLTENDMNPKKSSGSSGCEENVENLKHIESKCVINCDKNTMCTENDEKHDINYEKNLRPTELFEDNVYNFEGSSNCTENRKQNIVNCVEGLKLTENVINCKKDDINCEKNPSQAKDHEENNSNFILKYTEDHNENRNNYEKLKSTENDKKSSINCEKDIKNVSRQPKTKDKSPFTQVNISDASSQTDFQTLSLEILQTNARTQTEIKEMKHVATECRPKNLTNEGRNLSSLIESLPVNDNFTETATISNISGSAGIESVDCIFLKSLDKSVHKDCDELSRTNKNSTKRCSNIFQQMLNQIQEESTNSEGNDASKELRVVESNASISFASSGSSTEYLKTDRDETAIKEANTSPIKIISSETMAAFQVVAIRIRNIYRAIDIYKRKLRNKLKKTKKKSIFNKTARSCKEKPRCVSKSSSVDTIFSRKNRISRSGVIQMYETLRQAEVESAFGEQISDASDEDEPEASESVKSSSSTIWSYESASGKVELQISGKLSDNVVLRDVRPLMEFLVHKTEDSLLEKTSSVKKISNNACTTNENTGSRFSIFSRDNLLPLVYGVVCYVVFWCLHFTITCDIVL